MVSGVEPEADVLDIEVDAYLTKPVERAAVRSALSTTRSWRKHDHQLRDSLALPARKSTVSAGAEANGSRSSGPTANSKAE